MSRDHSLKSSLSFVFEVHVENMSISKIFTFNLGTCNGAKDQSPSGQEGSVKQALVTSVTGKAGLCGVPMLTSMRHLTYMRDKS